MKNAWSAVLFLVVAALTPAVAWPSDLPFGGKHLPQLVDSSNLVVVIKKADQLPGGSIEAALFEVTVDTVLKGRAPSKKLTVLVTLIERAVSIGDFSGAVAFLRGPMSEPALREWGIVASGDVYQVAAAGNGLIAMNPARLDAVESYIAAAEAPAGTNVKMKWAERQVKKPDDFLQTSAVFEIQRQKDKERALKALSTVVRSDASTLNARKLAVQVLASSPTTNATDVLQAAAENRRIPALIRRDAVAALSDRADGAAVLEKWKDSKDLLLSSEAEKLAGKKKE